MTQPEAVQAFNPRTGLAQGTPIPHTTAAELDRVLAKTVEAHRVWAGYSFEQRATVLAALADALDAHSDALVEIADLETALGEVRLSGEVSRTSLQLRLFADVLRDGGFSEVVLSPAGDGPTAPDVRRYLRPIGPVGVFSASNFPFAFSVAGGDTASALAAGCAVVVKAHSGHPHTSLRTYEVVRDTLAGLGAPEGVIGLAMGRDAGTRLVQHRAVKAIGFTGSRQGGRALFDLAMGRPDPIPFFGELGSVNPVVVLPEAARRRAAEIATGYVASMTLGAGQFCTNPGILFVPQGSDLLSEIERALGDPPPVAMLTERMASAYIERNDHLDAQPGLNKLGPAAARTPADGFRVRANLRHLDVGTFSDNLSDLVEECFGPAGLIVTYTNVDEVLAVLPEIGGNLTASIHAADADYADAMRLRDTLISLVGRLVFNGWPTGVRVCWAMNHGGPWPASTQAAHTSVGATAISRWLVPVALQDCPDVLLPPTLQNANPLRILRRVDANVGYGARS